MWEDSREGYIKTITELNPEVIIVLGVELKEQLPDIPEGPLYCYISHPTSFGFDKVRAAKEIESAFKAASEPT